MRKTAFWTLAILAAAAAAWAEQPVDTTRAVSPNATISIENVAGSLTIIGTDGTEVRVTGTMGDDVEEVEISGDAEDVSIEVVIPENDGWKGKKKIAADLEISVPRGANLDVEVVSATVDIRGVLGEIEVASVSSTVTVVGGTADIEIESVSGAVFVSGGSGYIGAESVSGTVKLEGVSGDIEATTVSGDIHIDAGTVNDVEVETVAGSVFFKGQVTTGDVEIESHSGNVELLLPAEIGADFEIETFSGSIDNEFGPPARRVDRYEPGMSAEFYTGTGGADIVVETFSGNISLKKF